MREQEQGAPVAGRTLAVLVLVLLVGFGVVYGARRLADWARGVTGAVPEDTRSGDISPGLPVEVQIPAGSSARSIAEILASAGVVTSSSEFELAVRANGVADRLQAGVYQLTTGMTDADAIDALIEGPAAETYRISLPEGLWVEEILVRLAQQTPYTAEELKSALLDGSVESQLLQGEAADVSAWEGLLFPATYDVFVDATAAEILAKLAGTMEQRVAAIDWSQLETRGLGPYEGIIVASLIEAEARLDDDRAKIATVIYNRIDSSEVVGIDASVIYAIGERGRQLTESDLAIDSPYNTRIVSGLPPTPIAAPGLASLEAAAQPFDADYRWYVLTGEDGSHSFTADYSEFLAWKEESRQQGLIP